jgi:hypothetical protein
VIATWVACSNGTIADALATPLTTPPEYECSTAQFSSASCGNRFSLRRLRLRRRPASRRAPLPLCRLHHGGSAHTRGLPSTGPATTTTRTSILPSGYSAGTPQEALDYACGLYLADPTAWLTQPPLTNQQV